MDEDIIPDPRVRHIGQADVPGHTREVHSPGDHAGDLGGIHDATGNGQAHRAHSLTNVAAAAGAGPRLPRP